MSDLIERLRMASLHEDSIEEETIAEIERLQARVEALEAALRGKDIKIETLRAALKEDAVLESDDHEWYLQAAELERLSDRNEYLENVFDAATSGSRERLIEAIAAADKEDDSE